MTSILDTFFALAIFPGGLFPLALGLALSFVLILAGFGVCDIASRFVGTRDMRPVITKSCGGQHD